MPPQGETGPKMAPRDDLYTFMLIAAAALLLIAIVFLAVRSVQIFGTLFPPFGT